VTISEPRMMGNIPHAPAAKLSVGNQTLPVKKLEPASARKGTPWLKTNTIIKKIAKIAEIAHSSRIICMRRSPMPLALDLRRERSAMSDVAYHSFVKKRGRGYLVVYVVAVVVVAVVAVIVVSVGDT
jgi:hypothetical protein